MRSTARQTPCLATLVPFRPDHDGTSILADFLASRFPAAMLTIIDPAKTRHPPARLLGAMFALTQAEAELSLALALGGTLQSYSDERQVSIHTARNQLKSVFHKTGTAKQSELVALIGRLTV